MMEYWNYSVVQRTGTESEWMGVCVCVCGSEGKSRFKSAEEAEELGEGL